jgi:hypothetical protein
MSIAGMFGRRDSMYDDPYPAPAFNFPHRYDELDSKGFNMVVKVTLDDRVESYENVAKVFSDKELLFLTFINGESVITKKICYLKDKIVKFDVEWMIP